MKSFTGLRISTLSALAIMAPLSPVAAFPTASSPIAAAAEEEKASPRNLDLEDFCDENHKEFKLTIHNDESIADDKSWTLSNALTYDVMDTGSAYSSDKKEHTFTKCLPICGAFKFAMIDQARDGIVKTGTTIPHYKLHVDGELIYNNEVETFEQIITEFKLHDDKCPEPSFRLVHKTPKKNMNMCIQPDGADDDAKIVYRPCTDARLKQRWTTNVYGHLMSTFHQNMKCATKVNSTLQLMDCPKGFDANNNASFIINNFSQTVRLDKTSTMKALRYSARDGSVRIREFDPKEQNTQRFEHHVEYVWDGPSESFPMMFMN